MQNVKFTTPDQYIAALPESTQKILSEMREIIKRAAPGAEELISYGMPAFKQNGMLVFYAVWKTHVGFYPSGSGIRKFAKDLAAYKTSKGAAKFPIDQPLPAGLITKIVKFRVAENTEKAALKTIAKTKK